MDSSAPRGPPDVPPRNPAMSRLNGRLPGSHAASDHERDPDLEPSCLVRTPSGNFYNIPSESAPKQGSLSLIYCGEKERQTAAASTWETVFPFAHEPHFSQFIIEPLFTEEKFARNAVSFPAILQISRPDIFATFFRPLFVKTLEDIIERGTRSESRFNTPEIQFPKPSLHLIAHS